MNDLGVIQDGSLLIRDGILEEVGATRRIENLALARGAREINAAGRVVMPGFVDSHTHLAFPPPGDGESDAADLARVLRAASGQRIEMRARGYVQAMARHGTTTVEAKTGCGTDESAESKSLRVLAALKRDPLDVIPTYLFREASAENLAGSVDWAVNEFMPKIRRRHLARFADLEWPTDDASCDSHYVRFLDQARRLGFALKVHAHGLNPRAAITAAVERFAVSVDHLEGAGATDAPLLAGSCTMATLLPCASFHSGGHAPARALLDAGVAVALATNFNPRHTPTLSMQAAVALACLRMEMTPAEAVTAATINGAHALGIADKVGSLEPGKRADLLILNASDYRELGREFGVNLVHMTMKRGDFIYREGEVAVRENDPQRISW